MLRLGDAHFTGGRSRFSDHVPAILDDPNARIYVKVRFGDGEPTLALLDTGAVWSVLDLGTAEALGTSLSWLRTARMSTRFGSLRGSLAQASITFPADEGEPLITTATFFVSEEWPLAVSFLGYSGLLDSIRFALDPQANHFYFGLPW